MFPLVITVGNTFPLVITVGNTFPLVITVGNTFLLVITAENTFPLLATVRKNNDSSFFLKKRGTSELSSVGHRRINRHVSPYFTYIKNMNKVIYNVSVLMLLTGHDFLDVGEKMVTTDFFIFLSLKKMSDMESGLSDQVGNFSVFKSFFRIDFPGFLFKFRANYWNFFATRFSLILNL